MFIPRSAIRNLQCLMLIAAALCPAASAGEFNAVLSIGDAAPAWKDLPGTDGKTHSLADWKDTRVIVVVFTCISCPTAVDYEQRMSDLASRYAEKSVAVVPICVNQVKQDRLEALTERVTKQKPTYHILYDESQQIAKDYGAVFTPEFFVLNEDRKVIYMGAMDDSTDPEKVKDTWVEQAILAALAGENPATEETIARGCRVRYAKERRKPE